MKIVIEIETDQFNAADLTPRTAAAQVAGILLRLIHGTASAQPSALLTRGVVGGDLIPLHDSNGTHVGAYSTRMED